MTARKSSTPSTSYWVIHFDVRPVDEDGHLELTKRITMTAEARKPKNKLYWLWVVGMALFLCLPSSMALQSQKRSLLEQSNRVVDMQKNMWMFYHCYWLSDHKVLFSGYTPTSVVLHTYDIQSQKEAFLEAASSKLGEVLPPDLSVSHDGTRLLWSDGWTIHGLWLDGSHDRTYAARPDGRSMEARWTGDSRHWVAFVTAFVNNQYGGTEAKLYDDDPSHSPEIVSAAASDQSDPLSAIQFTHTQSLVLGDHILACYRGGTQVVDILYIGIGRSTGLKTRQIQMPPNAVIRDTAIAPKGDRVAWILTIADNPPQDIPPSKSTQRFRSESLWVSNIDGTHMHQIGSRNLKAEEQFGPQILELQWLPGGKRLGFMCYENGWRLYTVSAK